MKVDPRDAVARIQAGGKLTFAEIADIRCRIEHPLPGDDLHNLLRAFALSENGEEKNVAIVEQYLESGDDHIVIGALYSLCTYWNLTSNYLRQLDLFSDGKLWKSRWDLVRTSLNILANDYFRNKNSDSLAILLSHLKNDGSDDYPDRYSEALKEAIRVSVFGARDAFINETSSDYTFSKALAKALLATRRH